MIMFVITLICKTHYGYKLNLMIYILSKNDYI